MKKVSLKGKLSIKKDTITKLNDAQMNVLQGGRCTNGTSGCVTGNTCVVAQCFSLATGVGACIKQN